MIYELISQTEANLLASGTLYSNSHRTDYLKQAMDKMIKTCLERIRQGETNIKSPMFLQQILEHNGSIENGVLSEYAIAQSGRDSLELCVGLLQKRAVDLGVNVNSRSIISPHGGETGDLRTDFDLDFFSGDADWINS